MKIKNLQGKRFGRLTVLNDYIKKNNRIYWLCRCDCGKEKYVSRTHLTSGVQQSCGCSRRIFPNSIIKNSRVYSIWRNMLQRCENPKSINYYLYGGKGISVCKEWHTSKTFMEWAFANGYKENLTIDRIDNSKNYCPENCRWATIKEQSKNRNTNKFLTYKGETKPMITWSEELGLKYHTLLLRIKRGWSTERALGTPAN